jgi:hypothetical protein
LEVSKTDIDGVTLSITPGVEIKGHVRVEGQLASSVGSFSVSLLPKSTNLRYRARANDLPNGSVRRDVSFLLRSAFEGVYDIYVSNTPENSFLKSARLDGVEVLEDGVTKVFAGEKTGSGEYSSTEFLQPFENRGESVHITEGSRILVQVDVIAAKDVNQ